MSVSLQRAIDGVRKPKGYYGFHDLRRGFAMMNADRIACGRFAGSHAASGVCDNARGHQHGREAETVRAEPVRSEVRNAESPEGSVIAMLGKYRDSLIERKKDLRPFAVSPFISSSRGGTRTRTPFTDPGF